MYSAPMTLAELKAHLGVEAKGAELRAMLLEMKRRKALICRMQSCGPLTLKRRRVYQLLPEQMSLS